MNRPLPCSPERFARLGERPDAVLAHLWKVSAATVRTWREQAGIPVYPEAVMERQRENLGVLPDDTIARACNLSPAVVAIWRQKWGIPRPPDAKTPTPAPASPAKPEGRRRGRAPTRLAPDQVRALGRCSDAALSERWGLHVSTVRAARETAGIPRWPAVLREEVRGELGVTPDAVLARRLGLHENTVRNWRARARVAAAPVSARPPAHVLRPDSEAGCRRLALLAEHGVKGAARHLGVTTPGLYLWLKAYGLPIPTRAAAPVVAPETIARPTPRRRAAPAPRPEVSAPSPAASPEGSRLYRLRLIGWSWHRIATHCALPSSLAAGLAAAGWAAAHPEEAAAFAAQYARWLGPSVEPRAKALAAR